MRRAPLRLVERGLERLGRDLARFAGQTDELDAATEKFRRAALIGRDVGFDVAEDGAPRRRHVGERQGICRRSGRHQEHGYLALENLREAFFDAFGQRVVAIAEYIAFVGLRQGGR